jgi:UDP-N-acetylglucosamine--N-acetylmuramyl-(pentapeptide) pyrophosphoryl-undecaprenol N-acetylglucosamine transferase
MSKKIFIVSGGTGGHIIPARCLSEYLTNQKNSIWFFGDRKLKNFVKNNDRYHSYYLSSAQFSKKPMGFLSFLFKTFYAFIKSLYFLIKIRPHYIYAFGGYATFPMLLASVITRQKIILHEQNAHIGKVNRLFIKFCYKVALSFEVTSGVDQKYLSKLVYTGNPVRKEIIELYNKDFVLPDLNSDTAFMDSDRMGYDILLNSDFYLHKSSQNFLKILVIGGSGGAKIFSEILPKAFFNFSEEIKEHIQIFQQCRQELVQSTFEEYKSFNINIVVDSYFEQMPQLIEESHLVIARAGSSSIFEFCCAGKPMILVPFAKSADDHQLKNAEFLQKNGAAIVIKESDFNIKNINEVLNHIFNQKEILLTMSKNAKALAVIEATTNLGNLINN